MSITMTKKPTAPEVSQENIPHDMRNRRQWVLWRYEQRDGKWTKVPYHTSGNRASSTNPKSWSSFTMAYVTYKKEGYDGIGYVFSGKSDDFVGIDLDHCRDPRTGELLTWTPEQRSTRRWKPEAPDPAEILELVDSYYEVSPSGTGVKIFVRGDLPQAVKSGPFETYSKGRYFTVTGVKPIESPAGIGEVNGQLKTLCDLFGGEKPKPQALATHPASVVVGDVAIIDKAESAQNSDKFRQLWGGDTSGYPSQSEADLALANLLAFWCGTPDAGRIDSLFRQSGLYRDKWDEVHGDATYGAMTIAQALSGRTDYFDWSKAGKAKPETPPPAAIGSITLTCKGYRKTPSKIVVTVEVRRGDTPIDLLRVSDALTAREKAAKKIASFAGTDRRQEIESALAAFIVGCQKSADEQEPDGDAPTVASILKGEVEPAVNLIYRTAAGKAFSETLNEDISRGQFIERFLNNSMASLCMAASDVPSGDDGVNRPALISMMQRELQLLWGDIINSLPNEDDATLPSESKTAQDFRAAIVTTWSKPASMGVHKHAVGSKGGGDSVQLASRTSLISRIHRMRREGEIPTGKWLRVQEGFDAWIRVEEQEIEGGELVAKTYLAMRWTLFNQIGVKVQDVNTQKMLKNRGDKYGALNVTGDIANVTSGGKHRLAILSESLTTSLLHCPENDPVTLNPPSDDGETSLAENQTE